jgi:hypothetical protein
VELRMCETGAILLCVYAMYTNSLGNRHKPPTPKWKVQRRPVLHTSSIVEDLYPFPPTEENRLKNALNRNAPRSI